MLKYSTAVLVSAITFWYGLQPNQSEHRRTTAYSAVETDYMLMPGLAHVDEDTSKKKNPLNRVGDPTTQVHVSPLFFPNPTNFKTTFQLDSTGEGFNIYERMGSVDVRRPSYISYEDYMEWRRQQFMKNYFREQASTQPLEVDPGLALNIDADALGDLFGGGPVSIRPTGFATLDFSLDRNSTDNPSLPVRQQRVTTFNFDQQIQLGVIGQIGKAMKLNANFDTKATFQFEDELKLEHNGTEDQILQYIGAGNVSMQLGNSLIQGRQNLFGLKTKLKFGPVSVTAIASTERGQVNTVNVAGGGGVQTNFAKEASQYDMNRHFFLSHFFREQYENSLKNLPVISSQVRIQRVEVWVEQRGVTKNARNAVGLVDLGENDAASGRRYNQGLTDNPQVTAADNKANNLYNLLLSDANTRKQSTAKGAIEALPLVNGVKFQSTRDFQVVGNMRRLDPNEYRVNNQLGFISLNSQIPTDQVLYIAYNYTYNGKSYQVGEFSDDVPADGLNSNVLFLRMLKPSVLLIEPYPAWDLMMKNVYNIGYGIQSEGFFLDVKYESGTSAGKINFLPTGAVANRPLIQVLNVDRLTNNTAPTPDNIFDYLEGWTVISDRGLIIFPVLEPFGGWMADRLGNDPNTVAQYVFSPLYDLTQADAIQRYPQLNRYSLEGYYQSSSNAEIPLNAFNLQEGSVKVTAGGRQLVEGQDFNVDYFGGKVTIINQSILTSGQPIQVSFENQPLYQAANRSLLGTRVEYSKNQDFVLGATIMNLRERPFQVKTTLGDEPLNNTIWGLDGSFRKESDLVTKLIDKIPLISTKEKSSINATGEFAQFIPGQPSIVQTETERGFVFLDDFEASVTPFNLSGWQRWKLASFPTDLSGQLRLQDPRTSYTSDLATNFTRAKLAWYSIDQSFYQGGTLRIEVPEEDLSDNYTRRVTPFELFPTASRAFGGNIQTTFDLHFIPTQRGPYNYQTDPAKIGRNGDLLNPLENWGGITRKIENNNDFEATNVDFLEFWMMDPFLKDPNSKGGEFYLNLGLVSEDVLSDESLSRENSLPGQGQTGNVDTTSWARVGIGNPPVPGAFDNTPEIREAQDIGFDGWGGTDENNFFQNTFLSPLQSVLSPDAFATLQEDPSSDNYRHFRNELFETQKAPILDRYLQFNGLEGNSPLPQNNNNARYTQQATVTPDEEDINQNGSLDFAEQYWEYRIRLHPDSLQRGSNYVVDRITDTVPTDKDPFNTVTWIQFRVPLRSGRAVNGVTDFKTISFMRMYMTRFEQPVICRMTEFQMVSSSWIRYTSTLADPGIIVTNPEPPLTNFQVGSVSIEENSQKLPFNYELPPGAIRQRQNGNTTAGYLQDERSLQMKVSGLDDGDARGVFKSVDLDLRQYENLKMWVHAEATEDGLTPSNFYQTGDATVFIRLGLDNDQNYYEYEIPLTPSDPALGVNMKENTWKDVNAFDIELLQLALAKAERNDQNTGLIYRHVYTEGLPAGHKIYVKGTPKLSDVRNIMIGIRNPKDSLNRGKATLEVWVNEMRLSNFTKKPGYAANAQVSLKLADLATLNGNLTYRSSGFGALDQRITQRALDDQLRYDISGSLNVDKFFPKKWGLQMPVYGTFGEQFITPVYNPQEADVAIKSLLENLNGNPEARDQVLRSVQDYTRIRSISFNNWRKMPAMAQPQAQPQGQGKTQGEAAKNKVPMPWDVSNLDFTFAYNETYARNSIIEHRFQTTYRGAVNYRYTFPTVNVQPFKGSKTKLLSEINFSPLPTSVSVALTGNRSFEERVMRSANTFGGSVDPIYAKNFMLNRAYNLSWNFTRSLQFTYTATNIGRVDEVKGFWENASQREQDSVGTLGENLLHFGKDSANGHDQLINFGRTTNFTHNFNLAYQLPLNKFKPTDWITGTVTYGGSFNWQQAPEINPQLGATIANSQSVQGNARADLTSFYRKFKFIRTALAYKPQKPGSPPPVVPGQRPGITPPPKVPVAQITTKKDSLEKPDPLRVLKVVGREVLKVALSVQNVDVNYNHTGATILPGYLPQTDNFGLDFGFLDTVDNVIRPLLPPTFGFIAGSQKDIRNIAAQNNWISRDPTLANLFSQTSTDQFTARTSLEPLKGLRVELSVSRNENRNNSEFFRWDPTANNGQGSYVGIDPQNTGSYNCSYIFIGTAFEKNLPESATFNDFSNSRSIISQRFAAENPNQGSLPFQGQTTGGFENGYLGSNQDVLIPALLAAYGVYSPEKVELTSTPKIPLPNWNVNYNLLTSMPFLKKYFQTLTLKHAYRASYTVSNFVNNLNAMDTNGDGFSETYSTIVTPRGDSANNFYSVNIIQTVQISEQFSPFLGLNMNFKNGVTTALDYKMGRTMALSVGNLQLTEGRTQDVSLTMGYRKDKVNMHFKWGGKDVHMNNSMNFQFRTTLRDSRERNRNLSATGLDPTQTSAYTRGTLNFIVSPAIDYVANKRLNIRVYYEHNLNNPWVSTAYRTSFASGGVQLKFTLSGT